MEDSTNHFVIKLGTSHSENPNHEVLKSATLTNAQLLEADGDVGKIAVGKRADILVLEANPLKDITVLTRPDKYLSAIMKDGVFYKNRLA